MIYTEGMKFNPKTKQFVLDKEWVNNNVMKMEFTLVDNTDANINTLPERILARVTADVYRFIRKNSAHYPSTCYLLATDEEMIIRQCLEYQLEHMAIKGDTTLADEPTDNISPNVRDLLYSGGFLSVILPKIPDVEVW